eukprot:m.185613 g.185613  ORF g.185613 m.185613 type:complete len:364 (+) comp17503_c2_seq1:3660-4751(+)
MDANKHGVERFLRDEHNTFTQKKMTLFPLEGIDIDGELCKARGHAALHVQRPVWRAAVEVEHLVHRLQHLVGSVLQGLARSGDLGRVQWRVGRLHEVVAEFRQALAELAQMRQQGDHFRVVVGEAVIVALQVLRTLAHQPLYPLGHVQDVAHYDGLLLRPEAGLVRLAVAKQALAVCHNIRMARAVLVFVVLVVVLVAIALFFLLVVFVVAKVLVVFEDVHAVVQCLLQLLDAVLADQAHRVDGGASRMVVVLWQSVWILANGEDHRAVHGQSSARHDVRLERVGGSDDGSRVLQHRLPQQRASLVAQAEGVHDKVEHGQVELLHQGPRLLLHVGRRRETHGELGTVVHNLGAVCLECGEEGW